MVAIATEPLEVKTEGRRRRPSRNRLQVNAAFCRRRALAAHGDPLDFLPLIAVHAAYVVAAVLAYRRRPLLGLAAAVAFVGFAVAFGTFDASRPHAHSPTSWFPQGSPQHWPCHTLGWVAATLILAPVPPLTLWAMRRARWSRPPRLVEDLTLATLVSAGAWLPAIFVVVVVLLQVLQCDYL